MRILVVEDERRIAEMIQRGLEEMAFAADVAYDGEQALDLVAVVDYDLILLDVLLPKKDGIEVCSAIRSQANTTPILMLTAKDSVEDRVTGLDCGADDYLVKPFAFQELLARIRALLRRSADYGATRLQVGDLVLDRMTRRAERGGRVIELTAREYSLLEFLMRHSGQAISRTRIARQVWLDNSSTSNVGDVYIRYLRLKIDKGFEEKLIKTVRGVGYKIEDGP